MTERGGTVRVMVRVRSGNIGIDLQCSMRVLQGGDDAEARARGTWASAGVAMPLTVYCSPVAMGMAVT